MRLGTFLLGGVAGAAAVIYLNRKSKSMMFSAFSSSSESMGKVMNKAKDTFVSKAFKDTGAKDSAAKSFSSSNTGTSDSANLNQVEKIVKEDPSLKATVNEILQDNKETATTIQ